ncbi:MAG: hypothetical protein MUP85_04705 [Candidatus Lokiarchaeota archaeon]|nr:hypothetical protein [Candidatus Lokiarchaeota archaeon]
MPSEINPPKSPSSINAKAYNNPTLINPCFQAAPVPFFSLRLVNAKYAPNPITNMNICCPISIIVIMGGYPL